MKTLEDILKELKDGEEIIVKLPSHELLIRSKTAKWLKIIYGGEGIYKNPGISKSLVWLEDHRLLTTAPDSQIPEAEKYVVEKAFLGYEAKVYRNPVN